MEKKLNSKLIYQGKIIDVYKDQVECQDGSVSYREKVHNSGGVGVIAIKNHSIILVKQYRYCHEEYTYEIPAGKIENNDPLSGAYRELEEETEYRAAEMNFVMKFIPTPAYTDEVIYLYEAKNFEKVENGLKGDSDEFIDVYWFDLDDAYQMCLEGKIKDAKTVIAIMYAKGR